MREEVIINKEKVEEKSVLSLSLKGKLWKYRGEGNANLVIALPQERLILRLHKWERDKEITPQIECDEEDRIWREVLFCRSVMVPLLGNAYIQPPRPACLDNQDLVELDKALQPLRPVYRTHKGIKFRYGTIYPDYALLPSGLKSNKNDLIYNSHKMLPLKSIENQSHNFDDLSLKAMKNVLYIQRRNCCKYFEEVSDDDDDDCDDDDDGGGGGGDDDIFIENSKHFNNGLEIPSIICGKTEKSYQYLSPFHFCSKTRGSRRFSTGSDFNSVLSFTSNPYEISTSAPVCSQTIFELDNRKNSVFCVEIKPKQGWIPFMDRYNPKCTFCLNQYLKLSKGSVEKISQYCPLDLFSGNESRMKSAIKNLLATPQNNLKLFKDGVLVYSDDIKTDLFLILKEFFKTSKHFTADDNLEKLTDKFCHLVFNALTTDLTDSEKLPIIEDVSITFKEKDIKPREIPSSPIITFSTPILDWHSCDWTSQLLPSDCILDRILKIQQLENSGADAVYRLYKTNYPQETDYEYVSKLCDHPEGILKLDPVQRYLLATTAKDCSILIAFQRISSDNCNIIRRTHIMKDVDGINYAWNIGISDLDPKPLSCIKKHRIRDAEVMSSYINYYKNIK
ncbi:inositol phosphate kinase 1 [Lycorma delicatula]|uniref:inositol phosphate kinase 1 n=1 Tax=Lycorma delicatula TaxID=130591 RepID=UPI003F511FED